MVQCGVAKSSNHYHIADKVSIVYKHGLPVVTMTLPSKQEKCSFTLKPLLSTVGQFLDDVKSEDKGIDTAVIHRPGRTCLLAWYISCGS